MKARRPAAKPLVPVPARSERNDRAGACIAEEVVSVQLDGGTVPASVAEAADAWQSGRATDAAWATLYRWAYTTLEGPSVRILDGVR